MLTHGAVQPRAVVVARGNEHYVKVFNVSLEPQAIIAEKLSSTLNNEQTATLLEIFDLIGILPWLTQPTNRFQSIEIKPVVWNGKREVYGLYWFKEDKTEVALTRATNSFNQPFEWGKIERLSHAAKNATQAVQRTLVHELGHHIHGRLRTLNKLRFGLSLQSISTNAASQYGKLDAYEYFAECFVAWVFHRTEFAVYDNIGYATLNAVLAELRIEVNDLGYSNFINN